jgi:hypothetical protein
MSHADPSFAANPGGHRYGSYYEAKRRELASVCWLLRHQPLALEVVRGIDVCTDELGVPTWVIAALFADVHRAAECAQVEVAKRLGYRVPRLRTTAHAGEDFVHLLGGLRRVDEALSWLCTEPGDRLGHALVLGIDPSGWAARVGRVALPKEERLWDLLWEWGVYAVDGPSASARAFAVEREIEVLARELLSHSGGARQLWLAARALFDRAMLFQRLGYPDRAIDPQDETLRLARRMLCDQDVFAKGREIVWIDPDQEVAALTALQEAVARRAARRGIVIEINPSSNLLIGNLGKLTEHPLWRLSSPRAGDRPQMHVCIGSDDPLTFATSLREEYQLVWDALVSAGLSDAEAKQWIERTRESSLVSRFTLSSTSALDIQELRVFSR